MKKYFTYQPSLQTVCKDILLVACHGKLDDYLCGHNFSIYQYPIHELTCNANRKVKQTKLPHNSKEATLEVGAIHRCGDAS